MRSIRLSGLSGYEVYQAIRWGSQSWLQPPFRRLFAREGSRASATQRLGIGVVRLACNRAATVQGAVGDDILRRTVTRSGIFTSISISSRFVEFAHGNGKPFAWLRKQFDETA